MMLDKDTTLCEGTTIILKSKINGAKYLWISGSRDSAITVTKTGKYWLQTVVGDCSITDTMEVNFIPSPAVHLGNDSIVCETDNVLLDAKNPGASYLWSTGEITQQITITRGGTYWVKVSGGNCESADTVIHFSCKANVIMPNAFTPNADNVNDIFRVYGTDIYDAQLTITNRWGEIIHQTRNINDGWDGNFKGRKCPSGLYFWTLLYWEYDGAVLYPKEKKGQVFLIP